jgi:hypothetical protein
MVRMKEGIYIVVLAANIAALFCIFNPWYVKWQSQGFVFFFLEALFLVFIGIPIFIHHLRKGRSWRNAMASSLDSVMNFLTGWI